MSKTRFDRAIAALVKGFFDETLMKGHCAACAVGNMVAAGLGVIIDTARLRNEDDYGREEGITKWRKVFCTSNGLQYFNPTKYKKNAAFAIDSTGYSLEELAKVEYAFEVNTKILFDEYHLHTRSEIIEDQYKGLMAVVDVLCEIEGLNADDYKPLFNYEGKFQLI